MDDCGAVSREDLERWDAEAHDLDVTTRSLVAISAGASANRPRSVSLVVQRHLEKLHELSDKVRFIRQTREALLKMTSIMGTPKAINALSKVSRITAESDSSSGAIAAELSRTPLLRTPGNYTHEQMRLRGKELFDAVYGKHADRVEHRLRELYPELAEVIMVDSYGRLLSESAYLCARDTELCAIASLVPQNVPVQLKSHCIGASRLGASDAMIQAALRLAKLVCTRRPL